MKILLIQPPWYGFQNIESPRLYLGLAYIAGVLRKNGYEVLVINGEACFSNIHQKLDEGLVIDEIIYQKNLTQDHPVYDEIMQVVKDFKPNIVGISFMTAVSKSAYYIAEKIKNSNHNIPIIVGGIHPTLIPEEPLNKNYIDYVVKGEGEQTILELIHAIEKKESMKNILGISYKKDGQIIHNSNRPFIKNLDELPFPAYELVQNAKSHTYALNGIITSRGCPFTCNYCASKLIWTRNVRFRSPENILEEIKDRYKKLGIYNFSFHDDTFTLNKKRVERICELIIDLDFKIFWHCDTRGDILDYGMLKLMKKAGCFHIYLGLETGSPKIQKLIKKNIDTNKVKEAVEMAKKVGIETTVYFMVGFPEETEDDILMSIQAMKDIKPDHTIWSILTPYPGTEIWNIAKKRGLIEELPNWDNYFHHYNQGNIFKSISMDNWNKMLKLIGIEKDKIDKHISITKIRRKVNRIWYLLKNPKILKIFIVKKCFPKK